MIHHVRREAVQVVAILDAVGVVLPARNGTLTLDPRPELAAILGDADREFRLACAVVRLFDEIYEPVFRRPC